MTTTRTQQTKAIGGLIGKVTHVDSSFIRVILATDDTDTPNRTPVDIGRFILVSGDGVGYLAQISELQRTASPSAGGPTEQIQTIIVAQLVVVVDLEKGELVGQGQMSPHIGALAYHCDPDLVRSLIESSQHVSTEDRPVRLDVAKLCAGDVRVAFTPEMMFGRHCSIIGTTGAGKSWSVARITEQLSQYNAKVLLLDASGEYGSLDHKTMHVYLGRSDRGDSRSKKISLPHSELRESDLFAMFGPSGQVQTTKLRSAIKTLKLLELDPSISVDGQLIKADKSKKKFFDSYRKHIAAVESTTGKFDILQLATQIENECIHPNRSTLESDYWGSSSSSEIAACVPLINRIEDMVKSQTFAPFFHDAHHPSLMTCIDAFIHDPTFRVLCVSLENLAFQQNVRPMVVNAIGRHLLEAARGGIFLNSPFLIILDEAHQFISDQAIDSEVNYPLDSFRLISNEGRKYGLNICLSTQRPRDIPDNILSQMGTFMVHRLVNDLDRNVIERASGHVDRSVLNKLPNLQPGEAVVLSCDLAFPLLIKVLAPLAKPNSHGANFQLHWR